MATPIFVLAGQSNARRIANEITDSLTAKYGADGYILITKYVAGAPITRDAPNKDDWGQPDELPAQLIEELKDTIKENPDTYCGGMIWVQGEADTWDGAHPELYRSSLTSMADRICSEVSSEPGSAASTFEKMPLIISELSDQAPAAADRDNWSLVIEEQKTAAKSSDTIVSVDPDGLASSGGFTQATMFDDHLHYSAEFSRVLSDSLVESVAALSDATSGTDDQTAGQSSWIMGTNSNDFLSGQGSNEVIRGRGGNDTLSGAGGDDNIRSGDGNDFLYGGSGNDFIKALTGKDLLDGGAGRDTLYAGKGSDTVLGGRGADTLWGEQGSDKMKGGSGRDELWGGHDNDRLRGGSGDDTLFGENGRDNLEGGAGDDILTGGCADGPGDGRRDVFVFRSTAMGGGGNDRVTDFEDKIDVLDLRSYGFDDFHEDIFSRASDTANGMTLDFGQGDILFLENFQTTDFDASDVLL